MGLARYYQSGTLKSIKSQINISDYVFWLSITLFFDPGGIFFYYFKNKFYGQVIWPDVFFFLAMISMLLGKPSNVMIVFRDKLFLKYIKYFILFFFYFFIIYGLVIPLKNSNLDYVTFIIKNREEFYSFFICILIYYYSLRSLKVLYNLLIVTGLILITLFFLKLSGGVSIIGAEETERFAGSGLIRIGMLSYGLIYWLFPLSLLLFLLNQKIRINIRLRKTLLFLGILMVIIELITLTRRTYINIIFTTLVSPLIVQKVLNTYSLKLFLRAFILVCITIIALTIILPESTTGIKAMFNDIYLLLTTGKGIKGETDYRLTGSENMQYTFDYIKDNYIFGIGYIPATWGDFLEMGRNKNNLGFAMAASYEVPILGALLQFGVVGMLLLFPLYYLPIKTTYKLYKLLKRSNIVKLSKYYNYDVLFSIFLILILLTKYTIEIYTLFGDFNYASRLPSLILLFAMLFALYFKMSRLISQEVKNNN